MAPFPAAFERAIVKGAFFKQRWFIANIGKLCSYQSRYSGNQNCETRYEDRYCNYDHQPTH